MPAVHRFPPEKRAAVIGEWLQGVRRKDLAARHGISLHTVDQWIRDYRNLLPPDAKKALENKPVGEIQKIHFDQKFLELAASSIDMLQAIVNRCSDPEFIKEKPESVEKLARFVCERLDRIVGNVRAPAATEDTEEAE